MKTLLLIGLMTFYSVSLFAKSDYENDKIYIETDLLNPVLKSLDITNVEKYDIRFGYVKNKWNLSLRYMQIDGIDYSGGVGSSGGKSANISDANDIYLGLRVGYNLSAFIVGLGVGSYKRTYDANFISSEIEEYKDSTTAFEIFSSYTSTFNDVFFKYELNYISASLHSEKMKIVGSDSYDIKYPDPSLSLCVLIGYVF